MKKQSFFIAILCVCISFCLYQKVNANQNLEAISSLTLEDVEILADNELSTGDCESRLVNSWTENLASSGATAIVNEYECVMSGRGSCYEGRIYDYYTSGSVIMGSEQKGSIHHCI